MPPLSPPLTTATPPMSLPPSPPPQPPYTSPPRPSCTLHRESYYVSPYIPLNRSPCATRFGRQVYQQLVTTTSAGDINSDSIVVSRSATPAGINIKLTLRSSLSRSIEPRVSHHRPTLPPSTGNPSFQILNTTISVHEFSQRTSPLSLSLSVRLGVEGKTLSALGFNWNREGSRSNFSPFVIIAGWMV